MGTQLWIIGFTYIYIYCVFRNIQPVASFECAKPWHAATFSQLLRKCVLRQVCLVSRAWALHIHVGSSGPQTMHRQTAGWRPGCCHFFTRPLTSVGWSLTEDLIDELMKNQLFPMQTPVPHEVVVSRNRWPWSLRTTILMLNKQCWDIRQYSATQHGETAAMDTQCVWKHTAFYGKLDDIVDEPADTGTKVGEAGDINSSE